MDLSALQANYKPIALAPQQQQQQAQQKPGGLKALAASLLPTIGGALGAVGGSFIAPIAGTAAGGAAGSALGEALRQRITGDKTSVKDIAVQGALGAIPGVFKGAKAGVTAIKGAKAAKEADAATQAATQLAGQTESASMPNVAAKVTPSPLASELPSNAPVPISSTPASTSQPSTSLMGKFSNSLTKSGSGLKVGGNVGDVNRVDQAAETFQRLGITGTPTTQLKKISDVMASHGQNVDNILSQNPIALDGSAVKAQVAKAIEDPTKFAELDLSTPGAQRALNVHLDKFAGATDAKQVNDYIKVLNPIASRAQDKLIRGAVLTDKETAALAAKKAGDEVLSQFPEIKPLKQDMAMLFERNPQVTTQSEKTAGIPMLGIKSKTAEGVASGIKSNLGQATAKVDQALQTPTASTVKQVGKSLFSQMTGRALAAPVTPDQSIQASSIDNTSQPTTQMTETAMNASNTNPNMNALYPNSDQNASPDYLGEAKNALASGNYKAFDAIMQLAALDQKQKTATGQAGYSKPSASQYSQAVTAMDSVGQLKNLISGDSGVISRNVTPGQGLPVIGSTISNLAGTSNYRALAHNILNSVARINTGANMPASEEAFYTQTYLPQPNDKPEVIQTKLSNLEQFFKPILNYSGGGNDLSSILTAT